MKAKERLAAALGEAGLVAMSERAARGYYADFESPLTFPITQLVRSAAAQRYLDRIEPGVLRNGGAPCARRRTYVCRGAHMRVLFKAADGARCNEGEKQ